MYHHSLSRIFLVTLLLLQILFVYTLNNETDELAMLEFKSQITEDPQGVFSSWNSSLNLCDWVGVTCGLKHKKVTALDLQGQKLLGIISPHIGNLSFIQVLNLGDNSFRGNIPSELGQLHRLRSLNLSFNSLNGQIPPNLSQCSNLVNLLLDHNFLVGHIPSRLGSLSNLVMLYLKNNNLTGTFPPSIGNLTSLRELYLSYNHIEGEVPNMSKMQNLTMLGLSVNSLSGVFPPSLYNLSSLKLLSLSFNKFHGNLRADIGLAFPKLTNLYLADNSFSGPMPVSLTNCSDLERLDLPNNSFTGNVPNDFGNIPSLWWFNIRQNNMGNGGPNDLDFLASMINCSKLQFLDISKNLFGGAFPSSITKLSTRLTALLIGGNQMRGQIPEEISNLVNLNVISMPRNLLTGKIPTSIGNLQNLQRLHLESNQLSGEIPSSLGNLSLLFEIYLQNNILEGTIPSSLGNCQGLKNIEFSSNKLSGSIPKEIMGLSSLTVILNVSYNSLSGPIPEEVGNLTKLAIMDISNNKFSGDIPSTLTNCISLEILTLQGNSFSGPIPSISTLNNLQYLDLSHNNLSGQIPKYMSTLPALLYLNLSFNNLEGEVPAQGVFNSSEGIELSDNANLCGGIKELHLTPCSLKSRKNPPKHYFHKLMLILVIVASCLVVTIAIFLIFCVKKRKNKIESLVTSEGPVLRKISYEEVLNGTSRLSSSNLIGSGNFGKVYKGTLHPDQTLVAVKVLNLEKRGASKSFFAECQALRNIRHRNLIKILTACSSIDHNGKDFKALVYQYMPNGSLEKWLYPDEGIKRLSIFQRLNIAIDVAFALDYLHNRCEPPVVHCDLKPSNVLLDNDFTARVSDFGLAQLLCKFSTEATLNQYSSLGIKGTIGYAPPEYGMGGKVSTEGDIYSFGILLLELFTGRKPTDDSFQGNLNLHSYVKTALPNQVLHIMDQSVLLEDVEEDSKIGCLSHPRCARMVECLNFVFGIGVSCSSDSPQDRSDMEKVAMELVSVREKFSQSGMHEELGSNYEVPQSGEDRRIKNRFKNQIIEEE